jgi:hypothetical protein
MHIFCIFHFLKSGLHDLFKGMGFFLKNYGISTVPLRSSWQAICDRCQHEVSCHPRPTDTRHQFLLWKDTSLGAMVREILKHDWWLVEVWYLLPLCHVNIEVRMKFSTLDRNRTTVPCSSRPLPSHYIDYTILALGNYFTELLNQIMLLNI